MRSKVARTLALALLLCGISMTMAQQPNTPPGPQLPGGPRKTPKQKTPPEKSKLEEMLAEALKNNPDIRVAAAKLAEADAELNRTRLQVIQKVVTTYHAIETQKKTIAHEEEKCKEAERAYKSGALQIESVADTKQKLALAKGKLEELEAQLPALLGKMQSTATAEATQTKFRYVLPILDYDRDGNIDFVFPVTRKPVPIPQARGNISHADKLRKALQTPVNVDYKDKKLESILDDLAKKVTGLSFRVINLGNPENKINLRFEEALPLSAVLQALSDEFRCCFYVRDYGILASDPNFAPPGALTVEEFLRQKPVDQPRLRSSSGKNPPEKNVEGLVKSADAGGYINISIGSDAGLAKGHTLELFRLNPDSPKESKYLGTIRILDVQGRESIAQAIGRLADTPKPGDRVASRILGK